MVSAVELTTKIQYKNFEPGEFTEERKRSYEETLALIEDFPWESERENIIISLTNASVTIEGNKAGFLKLALFYNGKFVLHYFDEEQQLFTKSFFHFKDAYPCIRDFFESAVFDTTAFKKENTMMQHNLIHFASQDFKYTLTPKSIGKYLFSTSGINFSAGIFFTVMPFIKGISHVQLGILLVLLLLLLFWGGGMNLLLFFNYYRRASGKILIMSKGNDIFYYGNKTSPDKFSKKEIVQVTTYKTGGSRNPVSGFAYVDIEFNNVSNIVLPNLLIHQNALKNKLYECYKIEKIKFPIIPNTA